MKLTFIKTCINYSINKPCIIFDNDLNNHFIAVLGFSVLCCQGKLFKVGYNFIEKRVSIYLT